MGLHLDFVVDFGFYCCASFFFFVWGLGEGGGEGASSLLVVVEDLICIHMLTSKASNRLP